MADSNFVLSRGYDVVAASPITKFRAVKAHASIAETVIPVAAATDVVLGVAMFDVTAADAAKGKQASVAHMGIIEMEASVALAVGALVGISANGRAAAAGAGVRTIGVVVGNPAGGAGEIVSVLLGLPGLLGVGA
jgi:hypothetical protein